MLPAGKDGKDGKMTREDRKRNADEGRSCRVVSYLGQNANVCGEKKGITIIVMLDILPSPVFLSPLIQDY